MDKINKLFTSNSKYSKLLKPLAAARVCDTARAVADGRFTVLTYVDGLLTVGCDNPFLATNLKMDSPKLIAEINAKLGDEEVKKIRFRIV